MHKFEWQMIHYKPKGEEMVQIEPTLEPGETISIAEFHDESCFEQNDHQTSLW